MYFWGQAPFNEDFWVKKKRFKFPAKKFGVNDRLFWFKPHLF